jgi:hypothetical protein
MKLLKQSQIVEFRLLCKTVSGDNCYGYNIDKNVLIVYSILFRYSTPVMLRFLAFLTAEQCLDPAQSGIQRRKISLPGSRSDQTAGSEIGCLLYTMSVIKTLVFLPYVLPVP